MIVIARPRNSGKTTILLHYMVVNEDSIYVARTEDAAKRAFERSYKLGLELNSNRFIGISNFISEDIKPPTKVLIDDVDYIIDRYFIDGLNLAGNAYVVTITNGRKK